MIFVIFKNYSQIKDCIQSYKTFMETTIIAMLHTIYGEDSIIHRNGKRKKKVIFGRQSYPYYIQRFQINKKIHVDVFPLITVPGSTVSLLEYLEQFNGHIHFEERAKKTAFENWYYLEIENKIHRNSFVIEKQIKNYILFRCMYLISPFFLGRRKEIFLENKEVFYLFCIA